MKEEDCMQMEMVRNNMRVILKFPKESNREEHVKREVKEILSGILKEQLEKNFILYSRKGKTSL